LKAAASNDSDQKQAMQDKEIKQYTKQYLKSKRQLILNKHGPNHNYKKLKQVTKCKISGVKI
jgi:hypothetical protein